MNLYQLVCFKFKTLTAIITTKQEFYFIADLQFYHSFYLYVQVQKSLTICNKQIYVLYGQILSNKAV